LLFFYSYVDDVILTAPENELDVLLETFGHERLQFTMEIEKDRITPSIKN